MVWFAILRGPDRFPMHTSDSLSEMLPARLHEAHAVLAKRHHGLCTESDGVANS